MNLLSKETSPYLLQHKNNPVHWHAWNNEALARAKKENKMMLVSIGYSACHWCHVMEREVFEDEECARLMNQHFVCIKVDREERPDVDAIYMDALHIMGRQGGWPLNVFTTPDGYPLYGGTYFPKQSWLGLLENLIHIFQTEPGKVVEYATRVQQALQELSSITNEDAAEIFDTAFADNIVQQWSQYWDEAEGGTRKAPKFPMPGNWEFLLHHAAVTADKNAHRHVMHTLTKMALGGIFDQVGGGFARYSVDAHWKVPHFEKMLYDNAQLVALYAQAFRAEPDILFEDVVDKTIGWLQREMHSSTGLYYAALDADSEGVEGKFYTWSAAELAEILQTDFELAAKYYHINADALWEHDQNILLRKKTDSQWADEWKMPVHDLRLAIQRVNQKILHARNQRIRPGIDTKCITSWNAMLVSAFCEAHKAFPQKNYLSFALQCAEAILRYLKDNETLWHTYTDGVSSITGFLDDYAFLAEACICLHEATADEKWLQVARQLVEKTLHDFYDDNDGLFFYSVSEQLIAGKKEIQDNVIPSSNGVMCKVLFKLALHLHDDTLMKKSRRMLANIIPVIDYASGYSTWLMVHQWMSNRFYEVVITGAEATAWLLDFNKRFTPNTLAVASTQARSLPLFQNRTGTKSAIYVCTQSHCLQPVHSVEEALQQLK